MDNPRNLVHEYKNHKHRFRESSTYGRHDSSIGKGRPGKPNREKGEFMTTKNTKQVSRVMLMRMESRLAVAATSASELLALRDALHRAIRTMGIRVDFSPDSDADLVDYLGLTTAASVSVGLGGAAIGTAIGALWDEPMVGLLIGGLAAALYGASAGVAAVDRGWRLRVKWLSAGNPHALLEPFG